jgi:hypothetical protein
MRMILFRKTESVNDSLCPNKRMGKNAMAKRDKQFLITVTDRKTTVN